MINTFIIDDDYLSILETMNTFNKNKSFKIVGLISQFKNFNNLLKDLIKADVIIVGKNVKQDILMLIVFYLMEDKSDYYLYFKSDNLAKSLDLIENSIYSKKDKRTFIINQNNFNNEIINIYNQCLI